MPWKPPDRRAREHARRRRLRERQGPVYAALDLGTNNCRMLAARPEGAGLRVVDSFSRIVRLGEGISTSGKLDAAAIERTIGALKICAGKMRRLCVRRSRSVATEACRRADNVALFLDRVERETGLCFEPITPREEARLTVAGCAPLIDPDRPRVLVFDIGGGSTEVMWVEHQYGANLRLRDAISLPLGVMTVAERYGCEVIPPLQYAEIAEEIDAELVRFDRRHGIAEEIASDRVQMIGTSGTVTTLGGIHLDLRRYNRSRVDGLVVPFASIRELIDRVSRLSVDERAAIPCVGRQRADLMVAGCTILEAVCRRWPVGELRVADRGIREGLLLEMMTADGVGPGLAEDCPTPPVLA